MLNVLTKVHAHLVLMDIIYPDQVVSPVILHAQPALVLQKTVKHAQVDSLDKDLNADVIVGLDLDLDLEEVFHFLNS